MLNQILFEYPAKFLAHGIPENVVRYGAILKDAETGRIVGHLQESGLGQSLLDMVSGGIQAPLSSLPSVVDIGTGVYSAVKLNQLHVMMQTLQTLQVATLGTSLVGLGVSVAGFIHMHQRFNAVDQKLQELQDAIDRGFEAQRQAEFRRQLSQTKTYVMQATHAGALSNPDGEYARLAAELGEQATYFEGELSFMIKTQGKLNPALFWQLTQLMMLCNNVRIDCSIRRNELRHAVKTSESVANDYQKLFDELSPTSFDTTLHQGAQLAQSVRDVTDAAATKPYLLDDLYTRRIDGREFLRHIESEQDNPLLIVKPT